ncbi:hypothetical protein GWA97_00170 [Flavobacterium sp. LaA7.5]|nr:hypothetical protein [Flavobacterium salilacus subsp. altitudinum]
MSQKTTVHAEDGKQELTITRVFDLPLELLFKAYTDVEIVAQWMGTKVLKLENKNHGGYRFETADAQGNVVYKDNGWDYCYSIGGIDKGSPIYYKFTEFIPSNYENRHYIDYHFHVQPKNNGENRKEPSQEDYRAARDNRGVDHYIFFSDDIPGDLPGEKKY